MRIRRKAIAGTLESSDIMITITEAKAITINLISPVSQFYGERIQSVIKEVLDEFQITGAAVDAVDHGALDCTVRARMCAAADRACREGVEGI